MTIIKPEIIPPRIAGVMQLHCMGLSGDVAGVVGQVAGVVGQVAGDCITTTLSTPVIKNKVHICC